MNINVNEIFYSIQGETSAAGFTSLFIRLAGCNLKCAYCDTIYARSSSSGRQILIDDLVREAGSYSYIDHVTITGGEPLAQPNTNLLMKKLIYEGHTVQLETNGSISLKEVPKEVRKIVDVKTPSSGEGSSFLIENLKYFTKPDELKFVILNIDDYKFSAEFIRNYIRGKDIIINFSPAFGMFPEAELADLILRDRLPVRLNLQLHKVIWPKGEPKTV